MPCSNLVFCLRAGNLKIKTYLNIILKSHFKKTFIFVAQQLQLSNNFLVFAFPRWSSRQPLTTTLHSPWVNPAADTVVFALEKSTNMKVHLLPHHVHSQALKIVNLYTAYKERICALIYGFHHIVVIWTTTSLWSKLLSDPKLKASHQIWGCWSTFSSWRNAWDKVLGCTSRRCRQHREHCRSEILSYALPHHLNGCFPNSSQLHMPADSLWTALPQNSLVREWFIS